MRMIKLWKTILFMQIQYHQYRLDLYEEFNSLKTKIYWPVPIFLFSVHLWANKVHMGLLDGLTFPIIGIYQFIHQWLYFNLSLYNTTWLSLSNELKFNA